MLCRKYPNRNIYIIGDHHFFHNNIIHYTREDFSSVLDMNEYIINVHNGTVGKEDIVIFLGDFCFRKDFIKDILTKMNGHKYLILGNHDHEDLIKSYPTLGFEGVYSTPIKMGSDYLSHEPLVQGERSDLQFQIITNEFKKCSTAVNYHGHIHSSDYSVGPKYKNVTCEALGYKPLLIGKTLELYKSEDKPLFINSPYVEEILDALLSKHNFDYGLLLSDYIYTHALETLRNYPNQYFVQGSVGLLKKFNFLSRFSDIDISFFYDEAVSKNEHIAKLKQIIDAVYEDLKQIDGINLSFVKRYSNIRILEMLYTSNNSHFSKNALDTNLIFLDCYRDTDFITLEGRSVIERFLPKEFSPLVDEYHFPSFESKFITAEGDIANLLLQMMFQKKEKDKKLLSLRKMRYIYSRAFKNDEMNNFSDIFSRLFLRNIAFLHTMHRFDEIDYIKNFSNDINFLLSTLPIKLQQEISNILNNSNSEFWDIYNEIVSVPTSEAFNKSTEIVKVLKRK